MDERQMRPSLSLSLSLNTVIVPGDFQDVQDVSSRTGISPLFENPAHYALASCTTEVAYRKNNLLRIYNSNTSLCGTKYMLEIDSPCLYYSCRHCNIILISVPITEYLQCCSKPEMDVEERNGSVTPTHSLKQA